MKYRYIHITAALFFIASMAVQFVVSYRRTMSNVFTEEHMWFILGGNYLRYPRIYEYFIWFDTKIK